MMTNTDDWPRFVEMMREAGWRFVQTRWLSFNVRVGYFEHRNGAGYIPGGRTLDIPNWRMGARKSAAHWRKWLEAGQTPPPF